ncbi:MAG: ABC transporter permease [Deltaproteobacteria bacterium]|nr:ABC transporter permease [Deltaproteobacteria bacterium]
MRATLLAGSAVLWLVLLLGLAGPFLPYDVVTAVDPEAIGLAPSLDHWLGTDHLGRDVAWRLLMAPGAFVGPGLLAVAVATTLGVTAGALTGFVGGVLASTIRYLSTVTASIPRFVLVLLVMTIYGSEGWLLGVAAGVAWAPALAEAVHQRIEVLTRAEFVLAARAHGIGSARILLFHLLWVNGRRMVGRQALLLFGYLLVLETTLSYLGGFGVPEPEPSWGNMLAFEFGQHTANPWGLWAPAIAIWVTVLATGIVSEVFAEREHA